MQAPDSLCLELHVPPRKKFQTYAKSIVNLPLLFSHLFEKQLLEISFIYTVAVF